MEEVELPAGIRPCLHEDGCPDANGPHAALTLAHTQTLFPVEPIDPIDARRRTLSPQQD